jgi:hypothetical protein
MPGRRRVSPKRSTRVMVAGKRPSACASAATALFHPCDRSKARAGLQEPSRCTNTPPPDFPVFLATGSQREVTRRLMFSDGDVRIEPKLSLPSWPLMSPFAPGVNLPLPALTGPTGPRGAHLRPINRTATIRCHPRFALEGQTKRGARRNETDRQVIHARLRSGSAHFSIRPREFWPRGVRCH